MMGCQEVGECKSPGLAVWSRLRHQLTANLESCDHCGLQPIAAWRLSLAIPDFNPPSGGYEQWPSGPCSPGA